MQLIEYFLHKDKILFSEVISFLDNFLWNSFAEYFFVIAEVEENIMRPFKVLSVSKLHCSNLIINFFISQIGEKLTKKEFSTAIGIDQKYLEKTIKTLNPKYLLEDFLKRHQKFEKRI